MFIVFTMVARGFDLESRAIQLGVTFVCHVASEWICETTNREGTSCR